jgi:hypothetical protein
MHLGRFRVETDGHGRHTGGGQQCLFNGAGATAAHHGSGNLEVKGWHDGERSAVVVTSSS